MQLQQTSDVHTWHSMCSSASAAASLMPAAVCTPVTVGKPKHNNKYEVFQLHLVAELLTWSHCAGLQLLVGEVLQYVLFPHEEACANTQRVHGLLLCPFSLV